MPILKLDPEKCRERNLYDAARGINAAPLTLSARNAPPPPEGLRAISSQGWWPADDGSALARINATLPPDGKPLTADQVLMVYPEAGNQNFIRKYWMHLGVSTLKNVRRAGEDGMAFMNSHRTGGASTPTELPYGRSFAARLETFEDATGTRHSRVCMACYMISGVKPNGANGPSTDELHAQITGGVLGDVSLGLLGGMCICDVCQKDMNELDEDGYEYVCPHVPGSNRSMTAEEKDAQLARGIPGGRCTFTLENGEANELSAVYDGALPGAGFRKATRLARTGRLERADLEAATAAFAFLLGEGRTLADPFRPHQPRRPRPAPPGTGPQPAGDQMKKLSVSQILQAWEAKGRPELIDVAELAAGINPPADPVPAPTPTPPPAPVPAPATQPQLGTAGTTAWELRVAALEEQLRQRDDQDRARRADNVALEAETWVDAKIRLGQLTVAERSNVVTQYRQAATDDDLYPTEVAFLDASNKAVKGSRLASLKAGIDRRPASRTGSQVIAGNPNGRQTAVSTLANDAGNGVSDADEMDAIYKQAVAWGERRNMTAKGRHAGV